jgi:hypothetical protein
MINKYYLEYIKIGLISISVFIVSGVVLSIPVWLLWNWLVPHIFGLPTINVLEAFGLSVLISLLSPRSIQFNKPDSDNIDYITEQQKDLNDKLESIFQDITSQFKA